MIRLKVLFTHELFPPYTVGGGEIYSETLVKELIKRGVDVTVAAGAWCENKYEIWEGIPVYRINLSPSRYLFNVKAYFALKKIIKEVKPDIVHATTYHAAMPACLVSHLYKKPIVLSILSLYLKEWFHHFNPIYSSFYYLFERSVFSFPYDKIIALDYAAYYNLCGLGLKKKSIVNEHHIDTGLFKPKDRKRNKFVVGASVTNVPTYKRNINIFVSLAERLKKKYDLEFLLVGMPDNSQGDVKSVGQVPHNEMPKYFNKMNVFIGEGIAAREAMVCGCIAVLIEPTEWLIRFHKKEIEEGLMLYGDHEKIIERLLSNPDEFKSLSKRSVEFIRKTYPKEKIMSKIIDVYEELIKKKRER